MTDKSLTIRLARDADSGALARLAALDSSGPLTGESLLAEVGGEIWAAVALQSGNAVADPFRPSADLVELLRFRVERMRRERTGERRRLASMLPRAA